MSKPSNPTIRKQYFVHKCPNCRQVLRLVKVNGIIEEVEGLYRSSIGPQGRGVSEKTVLCSNLKLPPNHPNFPYCPGTFCGTYILVRSFKEIIL